MSEFLDADTDSFLGRHLNDVFDLAIIERNYNRQQSLVYNITMKANFLGTQAVSFEITSARPEKKVKNWKKCTWYFEIVRSSKGI